MKWAIDFKIAKAPFGIDTQDEIFWLGSCFAERMGERFAKLGWKSVCNPFGIIYNPISIENIGQIINGDEFKPTDFFEHQALWRHWLVHSDLAEVDLADAVQNLNRCQERAIDSWQRASVLVLTLGSAFAWRHLESGRIVANCHQVPSRNFKRELLSIQEMKDSLSSVIAQFSKDKANVKIVLTVSPVRYLRDGLMASNRSKGRLLEVAHQIVEESDNCYLFPAYEILIDQLRDYRFFDSDRVHPSTETIDEIWKLFIENTCSKRAKKAIQEGQEIQKMLAHQMRFPQSETARKFIQHREIRIAQWEREYGLSILKE